MEDYNLTEDELSACMEAAIHAEREEAAALEELYRVNHLIELEENQTPDA